MRAAIAEEERPPPALRGRRRGPPDGGHACRGLEVQRLVEHGRGVEVVVEPGEEGDRALRSGLPDELAVVDRGDRAEQRQPPAHVGPSPDRQPAYGERSPARRRPEPPASMRWWAMSSAALAAKASASMGLSVDSALASSLRTLPSAAGTSAVTVAVRASVREADRRRQREMIREAGELVEARVGRRAAQCSTTEPGGAST